jgi:hypothetical protein
METVYSFETLLSTDNAHDILIQESNIDIFNAVRTSNLRLYIFFQNFVSRKMKTENTSMC